MRPWPIARWLHPVVAEAMDGGSAAPPLLCRALRAMGRKWIVLFVVALALLAGGWFAHHALKARKHPGLGRFIKQLVVNYPASFAVEPPLLSIEVEQGDMDRLRQMVDAARERGVILPEGRPYLPAWIEAGDDRFKARVRIKGKMTDHVKGSKWSFRIVAKKDGGFLGMRRFSIQHPGTRNYLCEWLHHRLMEGEGVIALRYGFVRVRLNGDDLGIYAYEEHFGPELLERNGRLEGPLFRFDPGLYWEHRLNEMRGLRFNEPYAAYQAASVDAFGTGDLAKDTLARRRFEEAVALMEAFRRGRLAASEVFDADRVARRHALLDLVGGHRSLDWSDVKFYYDPVARRIEPVAYESAGAFPIRALAGSHRFTGRTSPDQDIHDAWFNDETIFRAYVRHLERVSRQTYLDSAFQALGPALDSASATVYREFPYKELDRSVYRRNQEVVRRLLDGPKGFHAYSQGLDRDTLTVMAVPVDGLPMEVHGLRLADGGLVLPVGRAILPCRPSGRPGSPVALRFVVPDTARSPKGGELRLVYSVLGASVRKELDVFPWALLGDIASPSPATGTAPDMRVFPFVAVDEDQRVVTLRPGVWTLDQDLVVPAGYTVRGTAPLRLDLVRGARIISRSPLSLAGLPDEPVLLTSSDRSGGGVLVLEAPGTSVWSHVRMTGFGGAGEVAAIAFSASAADLRGCVLGEDPGRDLLLVVRARLRLYDCSLVGGRRQIVSAYAELRVEGLEALGAGGEAIVLRGGMADVRGATVDGARGAGVKLVAGAELLAEELAVRANGRGIGISEGGRATVSRSTVHGDAAGVDLRPVVMRYGPSRAELTGTSVTSGKLPVRCAEGNTLTMDGKEVKALRKKQGT